MTIHGDETQDLRRRIPQPAGDEHERRIRRFGRRSLIAGIALPVAVYLAGLAAAVLSENDLFHSESARLFAVLGMVALTGLGFMLAAIGGMEHLQRSSRDSLREYGLDIDRNRILLERLTMEFREGYELLAGGAAEQAGRLRATEDSLQVLIAALPDEIQRQYWSGFNDAVKEGFQTTGTEGNGRRPVSRIGLVPPDGGDDG